MTRPSTPTRGSESGFSLMEILVVMLIIGILAAIALPRFLSQEDKSRDAVAKHDARSVAGEVESCFATEEDYRSCDTSSVLSGANVSFGSGAGQVSVSASALREYKVTAHSRSGTDFLIARTSGGDLERTCTPTDASGCGSDAHW